MPSDTEPGRVVQVSGVVLTVLFVAGILFTPQKIVFGAALALYWLMYAAIIRPSRVKA